MHLRYLLLTLLFCSLASRAQVTNATTDTIVAKGPDDQHVGGSGFKLAEGKHGSMTFSFYVLARYLNQTGLDETYTNHQGNVINVDRRNDIMFQKSNLYFRGWALDPKLKYFIFVWTSNATQGQGAQISVAGNVQYKFNKYLEAGVGVNGLPAVRSILGQWPQWLRADARPIADEYFRASFTMGVWLSGEITEGVFYKTMLGNNMSTMGVDAGQLDDTLDTWSSSVWWVTNGFGNIPTYGDYEKHTKIATVLGGAFTTSTENRQSQPDADAPENSQIRISDGTGIFAIGAFAPNTQVIDAKNQMTSIFGGLKYNGFSLDAEYFMRWVSIEKTAGVIPVSELFDSGYSLQASAMLIDKKLQLYSTYAYINGEYGNPSEVVVGLNWFPLKNKCFRINPEVMVENHSPVGYLSYPTQVGSNGVIGMINLELNY